MFPGRRVARVKSEKRKKEPRWTKQALGRMLLLRPTQKMLLGKGPAQDSLCEQLLSRKALSNRPGEVPLLQGHKWHQGDCLCPTSPDCPGRGTATRTMAEL